MAILSGIEEVAVRFDTSVIEQYKYIYGEHWKDAIMAVINITAYDGMLTHWKQETAEIRDEQNAAALEKVNDPDLPV